MTTERNLQSLPIPSFPQSLATVHLLLVSMDLPIVDIRHHCSRAVWGLLCLTSFTLHDILKFLPSVACISTSFLFMAIDILYPVYPFISQQTLGCFHFLAMRIMLLWTFVYMVLCGHTFFFLLDRYLSLKLPSHVGTLRLTFWGTTNSFPKRLHFLQSRQQV